MVYIVKEISSQDAWDGFVREHAPTALFQGWAWGEVEKKMGHRVWRRGWFEKNKLVGVAQIVKVSARRGTFLHLRHGPIGKINFEDLKNFAKTEKAWFVRISPHVQKAPYSGLVPAPIHAMDAELCWVLDLDKSEEELLAGMRKTTRYEIKHAGGVTVKKSNDIERFFALYNATSARHNFVQHKGIREEFETLDCDLFIASHQGRDLAAAIVVYFGDEAIYHHGASIPNKAGVSYAVQWEAIREAKKRGKKIYNFWGIAPDTKINHPWRGITLFKTGFGGRQVEFMHAQDYLVSPFAVIPRTVESLRKRLKGY